jgi:glycosyltransferase involved in cell wall biosynthesis
MWSHRWEADKDPATFLRVACRLRDEGLEFRLVLMGDHLDRAQEQFAEELGSLERDGRIVHAGYVGNRAAYVRLLSGVDIAVSTARHEFFGIGVVESIAAGAWPLLPERLAYPEILPEGLHGEHLYRTENQLRAKLRSAIVRLSRTRETDLGATVRRFDWSRMIGRYDRELERAARE